MAVSRPLLLALVGMLLAGATFYAARNARDSAAEPGDPGVAAIVPATPKPPADAAGPPADQPGGPSDRTPAPDRPAREPAQRRGEAAHGRDDSAQRREGATQRHDDSAQRTGERSRRTGDRRRAESPPRTELPTGVPKPVARALARRQVVVLFFRQGGGADDAATADAVAGVRGRRGVAVFSDSIERLARYRAVTSGLGIAQAPAVTVIDRRREARLMEGFVDEGTLTQWVLDAR